MGKNYAICALFLSALSACSGGGSGSVPAAPPAEASTATLVSRFPAENASAVPVSAGITVDFDQDMDPSSFHAASFQLFQGGNQLASVVTPHARGALLQPSAPLPSDSSFTVLVTSAVRDAAGCPLAQEISWSFRSADVVAPSVAGVFPFAQQQFVSLQPLIRVIFSETIDPASVVPGSVSLQRGGSSVKNLLVTVIDREVRVMPLANLDADVEYEIFVQASAIRDLAGNVMKSGFRSLFRTTEFTPPSVDLTDPADGAIDVDLAPTITAKFSEPIDPGTVGGATISLEDSQGAPIPFNLSVSGDTVVVVPASDLPGNQRIFARILGQVRDLAGNPMGADAAWSFVTRPKVFGLPKLVEPGDTGDAIDPKVAVLASTGEAIAIWREKFDKNGDGSTTDNPYDVVVSHMDPQGNWGPVIPLEDETNNGDGTDVYSPAVAIEPLTGRAIAAWTQNINAAGWKIYASHFDPASGWGAPRVVAAVSGSATAASLLFSPSGSGDALLGFWQRQNYPQNKIDDMAAIARYDAASDAWMAPQTLNGYATPQSNANADTPALALAADGAAFALWREAVTANGNQNRLFLSALDPSTGAWSSPFQIGASTGNIVEFQLGLDGSGRALAAWTHTPTGAGAVRSVYAQALHYDFALAQWAVGMSERLLETDDGAHADGLSMATSPAGDAKLVWLQAMQPEPARVRVQEASYDHFALNWSAPLALDRDARPTDAAHARIASGPGETYFAAWIQPHDETYMGPNPPKIVYGKQYGIPDAPDPATASWRVVAPVEPAGVGDAISLSIAIDGQGRKVVVWSEFDGNFKSIFAAQF